MALAASRQRTACLVSRLPRRLDVRTRHRIGACLVATVVCLAAAADARAASQAPRADTVSGVVSTPAGQPVRAASVSLHDAANGAQLQRTATDADGRFAFEAPSRGYLVVVTARGFSTVTLPVAAEASLPLQITLETTASTRGVVEAGGRLIATGEVVDVTARHDYRTPSTSVATKTDTPMLDVPMNVTVTDRTQLDDMQAINIAKSHDYTVGFTSTGETGLAQSRGFEVSWYDYRRDGLRTYAYSFREPAALDRVQYLRGPSAVLYGDGSPGGLVNLVLKKPLPVPYREATVGIGTLGLRRGTFDITGPLNASTSLTARAIVAVEGFDAGNRNAERRLTLLPTATYQFSRQTSLTADAEYDYERGRGYNTQTVPATPAALATGDLSSVPFGFNVASPDDSWYNWNVSPGIRLDTRIGGVDLHTAFRYTRIVEFDDAHWLDGLADDGRTALRSLGESLVRLGRVSVGHVCHVVMADRIDPTSPGGRARGWPEHDDRELGLGRGEHR